jgi:hypothetical protein
MFQLPEWRAYIVHLSWDGSVLIQSIFRYRSDRMCSLFKIIDQSTGQAELVAITERHTFDFGSLDQWNNSYVR